VGIVRLKRSYIERAKTEKINELLGMFNLPHVSMKGYETKQLVGASSAAITTDAQRLNAVNELRKWYNQCLNKRK
jgi:hypothetical protein